MYRVYGDEYGDFLGVWFQWPIARERKPYTDTIGLKIEIRPEDFHFFLRRELDYVPIPSNLVWPDVTPRAPYTHEWIEDSGLHE